jgi:hypothetical protein
LKISVRDWANKGLIGKTFIDLEDRYFSSCYAMCGIPKRYEKHGYNAWRDVLTPWEILEKLCKQWRLKKPDYESSDENVLRILDIDENLKEYSYISKTKKNECVEALKKDPPKINSHQEADLVSIGPSKKINPKDCQTIKQELALMVLNDWENITRVWGS